MVYYLYKIKKGLKDMEILWTLFSILMMFSGILLLIGLVVLFSGVLYLIFNGADDADDFERRKNMRKFYDSEIKPYRNISFEQFEENIDNMKKERNG